MKTRRSLPLKNLQTRGVLFHVVSAATEIPQGLMGAQRKGPHTQLGEVREGFPEKRCPAHSNRSLQSSELSQEGCPPRNLSEHGVF